MVNCVGLRRNSFVSLLSAASLLVLLTACATTQQTATSAAQLAPPPARMTGHVVNIKNYLPVRTKASLKAQESGRLMLGDSVNIEQESGEWLYVAPGKSQAGQSLQGWVLSKYIERDPLLPAQPPASGSQAESKDLSKMKTRTVLEGGLAGAALGAGLGAATAALTGGDVAKGAIIGAGAGAVGGLIAGNYVANQKEKFATEETYLDACIKEAAQFNQEARSNNEYLKTYIKDTQARVQELKAQIKADRSKKQVAANELAVLGDKKQALDKLITNLDNEIRAQESAIAGVSTDSPLCRRLKSEVQTTRLEIEKLKAQREQLNDLTAKMNGLTV